jgi:uncharacterized protein Veg
MANYKEFTNVTIPNLHNYSTVDAVCNYRTGKHIKNKYCTHSGNSTDVTYEESISKMTTKTFKITKTSSCTFIIKNYDKNHQRITANTWSRVFLFQ